MDDLSKNKINNYIYRYKIENTDENFQKLAQVINRKKYFIYKQIFYMTDACRIVSEDSSGIIIEIDSEEHNTLLEDVAKKIFIKKIGTRKVEERAYVVGNLFLTLLYLKNLLYFLIKNGSTNFYYMQNTA